MKTAILLSIFLLFSIENAKAQSVEDVSEFSDLFRRGAEFLAKLSGGQQANDNYVVNNNNNDNRGSSFKNFCNCRLNVNSRIVGGKIAQKDAAPWMVSLGVRGSSISHFCGGTIINDRMILTATHCLQFLPASIKRVVAKVGSPNLNNVDPSNVYEAESLIPYRKPMNFLIPSDFAIIKLKQSIKFIKGVVEPACFNLDKKRDYKNSMLTGLGYGMTSNFYTYLGIPMQSIRGKLSKDLKQADLKQRSGRCLPFIICVEPRSAGGGNICMGDSGSPLHYTDEGITTVEGPMSFLTPQRVGGLSLRRNLCNGRAYYARASYYKNWFESKVGEDAYCKV